MKKYDPIISSHAVVRGSLRAGNGCIVDAFTYISVQAELGDFTHVAAGVNISGGAERKLATGRFCGIASGVRILCATDDFKKDLMTILPKEFGKFRNLKEGDVKLGDYVAIGVNSVVLPGQDIPEGVAIGSLSLVPSNFKFEPWSLYAGVPVRKIGDRDKDSVMKQVAHVEEKLNEFIEKQETKVYPDYEAIYEWNA